jgi:hypothetical protein
MDWPGVIPGGSGRWEGGSKINANGMIVFPGAQRMYQQRHLNWGNNAAKSEPGGKSNKSSTIRKHHEKPLKQPFPRSVEKPVPINEHEAAGSSPAHCSYHHDGRPPHYRRSRRNGQTSDLRSRQSRLLDWLLDVVPQYEAMDLDLGVVFE